MKTTQRSYTFDNLNITQTIFEDKTSITKVNDVSRKTEDGNYELLGSSDPDYKKALILMHNFKNHNQ